MLKEVDVPIESSFIILNINDFFELLDFQNLTNFQWFLELPPL